MARFFTLFAVLLAVFQTGSCLNCYQCNSAVDRDTCKETFTGKNNLLKDCSMQDAVNYNSRFLYAIPGLRPFIEEVGTQYCAKMVTNNNEVFRTCLASNPASYKQKCEQIKKSLNFKHCEICENDGCNGSSAVTASIPLAFLAVAASYLFYKQ